MRYTLIIVLLSGIIGQAAIRTAWTIHYQWNRAAYLEKCVNKDKPNLHCNGQCAFMKEMAAWEKSREPQLPEHFREVKDIQLFFETEQIFALFAGKYCHAGELPPYQCTLPDPPARGILKPPA